MDNYMTAVMLMKNVEKHMFVSINEKIIEKTPENG